MSLKYEPASELLHISAPERPPRRKHPDPENATPQVINGPPDPQNSTHRVSNRISDLETATLQVINGSPDPQTQHCRGISLIRNTPLLGPYRRTIPRDLWWS